MVGGNDGFSSQLAGMSKNQLFDVMSQMKNLIDQNQEQARKILIEHPVLTKALFQAQIMLGMVQPPQVKPNIQQAIIQNSAQPGQQPNFQTAIHGQVTSSQSQTTLKLPNPNQPSISVPSTTIPPATLPSQNPPSHSLLTSHQGVGHLSAQPTSMSLLQSSPFLPLHSVPQSTTHQPQMPNIASQAQQSPQSAGIMHQPLQPPLQPQSRPPPIQPFPHQIHSQMAPSLGFPPPQQLPSQSVFHPGSNNPQHSFSQGQPTLHPPNQKLYQAGSNTVADFNSQAGSSMQAERGSARMPGPAENPTGGAQLPGPPPLGSSQMVSNIQPPAPQLTPEMEKALLQQVMSLTPEQINLLPPEQRNQVLQLQKMLR